MWRWTKPWASQLSADFRTRPISLLSRLKKSWHSAVLHNTDYTLKIITVEVYSRHASIDIHCESESLASTLTQEKSMQYPGVFCGTIAMSDAKRMKRKVILASRTMDVLSTCSTTLEKRPRVFIGPETDVDIISGSTQIFFSATALADFKKAFEEDNDTSEQAPDISRLRQFSSSFQAPSTYRMFRFTSSPFNGVLHMPATVFTNCDLPSFAGYGSNAASASKMASELLQIFIRAALIHSGRVKKVVFEEYRQKYDAITKKRRQAMETSGVRHERTGERAGHCRNCQFVCICIQTQSPRRG